ncbi:MAG: methyltransferase domain-containing protein [Arenicellales bacterium]|nr:SAM-dependent methyltransferase [Acidiferrobacteraceae bacterium]MDP6289669.1 methyltransferase domain-containing protein [Arenicellales bacterium]MDP6434557.1 methyltransferase domain-containing protein [Arenicellales bacterium]MDP6672712.1 methyltransferase domain-containing protein [Arenicellales bacterium]MDP7156270.1 methyltransferase domain-containing protein [Arenicellales bacterium]
MSERSPYRWFNSRLGRDLMKAERGQLSAMLPDRYFPVTLQIGCSGTPEFVDLIDCERCVLVDIELPRELNGLKVIAEGSALPFGSRSSDLVLLPHTLDFSPHPHQLLREVVEILVPEGLVALTGLNPYSLWGGWRWTRQWRKTPPWNANYFSPRRVQDWMSLLDLEIVSASLMEYRLPTVSWGIRDRLGFLEVAGARWWPGMAAVYLIIARKRELGVRPQGQRKSRHRRLATGYAGTMAKS